MITTHQLLNKKNVKKHQIVYKTKVLSLLAIILKRKTCDHIVRLNWFLFQRYYIYISNLCSIFAVDDISKCNPWEISFVFIWISSPILIEFFLFSVFALYIEWYSNELLVFYFHYKYFVLCSDSNVVTLDSN